MKKQIKSDCRKEFIGIAEEALCFLHFVGNPGAFLIFPFDAAAVYRVGKILVQAEIGSITNRMPRLLNFS